MKLSKIAYIFALAFFAIILINGCSSTEQTTAKLAFQQGDFEKARIEFEKEVKNNPQNEEAWYYLGASNIMLNRLGEADLAFQEYRKIGKNTFANEITDAWLKRYNQAADKFENAQKTTDKAQRMKFYQEAINEFRISYIILPDSQVVLSHIKNINSKIALENIKPFIDEGVRLLEANDFDGSIDEFQKAVDINLGTDNPNYYIVQYNMGVAYLKWGEDMRTKASNPDDMSYKEKYRAALPYIENYAKSPDKTEQLQAWELLVQVYANLGMTAEATDAIKTRDALRLELNK